MARRTFLYSFFENLWKKHEQLYTEIFLITLRELAEIDSLSGKENALSERMYPVLNRVCRNFSRSRGEYVPTPSWELPIAPVTKNELRGGKKSPCPDFTCKCYNKWAGLDEESEISFHVECKLLGERTSSRWVLNKNYVTDGIQRFDAKTHEYGKRAHSGMMIGYIVNMCPEKITEEVNSCQKKHLPDNERIVFDFNQGTPFQTRQQIKRKNVLPGQFALIHLWVDLRNNYQP